MKNLNTIIKICFIFFAFAPWTVVKAQNIKSLKIETGRYIAYENHIINPEAPVFIFLPGIYRGLDSRDQFVLKAIEQKINFITLNFSAHPESIAQVPILEISYPDKHNYSSKDFATEVEKLITDLKIKNPIIVSLSYSSSVSVELAKTGKYKIIIETAPMIRFDEANPSGGQITDFYLKFFNANPFIGPYLSQWYLKQTYQTYWNQSMDSFLIKYPKYNTNLLRSRIISGFTQMSMSVHGFDYSAQNFNDHVERLFVLGENEDSNRSSLQLKAVQKYEKTASRSQSIKLIKNAGHIVPEDNPQEYIDFLQTLSN